MFYTPNYQKNIRLYNISTGVGNKLYVLSEIPKTFTDVHKKYSGVISTFNNNYHDIKPQINECIVKYNAKCAAAKSEYLRFLESPEDFSDKMTKPECSIMDLITEKVNIIKSVDVTISYPQMKFEKTLASVINNVISIAEKKGDVIIFERKLRVSDDYFLEKLSDIVIENVSGTPVVKIRLHRMYSIEGAPNKNLGFAHFIKCKDSETVLSKAT